MSANNSNAPQRNRAIRNSILLVLLLMLLACACGSLFPRADCLDAYEKGNSSAKEFASLRRLKNNYDSLNTWLQATERQYNLIAQKDKQWGTALTSNEREDLQQEIRRLESGILDRVNALKQESGDTLLRPHVTFAYAQLLIARGMLWDLRKSPPPPLPQDDPTADVKNAFNDCKQEAKSIADAIDRKVDAIEPTINDIKRKVNRDEKSQLEGYLSDLKELSRRLRSI